MTSDRITLTVPARSEFAKTVRMTAAALAGRADMSYDDVEDVRIAAEEAFVYASETLPEGAEIEFGFICDDTAIAIEVRLGVEVAAVDDGVAGDDGAERAATYAVFILRSVSDEYEFKTDESGAYLRLVKYLGSRDAG